MLCWKEKNFGFCCFGREKKEGKENENQKDDLYLNLSMKFLGRRSRVESSFILATDETHLALVDAERIAKLIYQNRAQFETNNVKFIKSFVRDHLLPTQLINDQPFQIPTKLDLSQNSDIIHILSLILARILICFQKSADKPLPNDAGNAFIVREISRSNSNIMATPNKIPATPEKQPSTPLDRKTEPSKGVTLSRRELLKPSKDNINLVPLSAMNVYFKGIIKTLDETVQFATRELLLSLILHTSQNLLKYSESEDIAFKSAYSMIEENMGIALEIEKKTESLSQTEMYFKELINSQYSKSLIEAICSQLPQNLLRERKIEEIPILINEALRNNIKIVPINNCNLVGLCGFNNCTYLSISEDDEPSTSKNPDENKARILGSMFHHCFEQALAICANNLLLSSIQKNNLQFENIIGINIGFQVEKFLFASLDIEYWRGEHARRLMTKDCWQDESSEFPFGNHLDVEHLLLRFPRVVYFPYTFGLELKPKTIKIIKAEY